MLELSIRYLHFIGILVLVSMLVVEHLLLKGELLADELRRLARVDAIYGISALVVLATGLTMWLLVGKPAGFYTANPVFHAKVTLFILLALLSIYPTIFLTRHRRSASASVSVPRLIPVLLRIELFGIIVIPLLAVLMARGVGLG